MEIWQEIQNFIYLQNEVDATLQKAKTWIQKCSLVTVQEPLWGRGRGLGWGEEEKK